MVKRLILIIALCAASASAVSKNDIIARKSAGGAPPVDLTPNLQHYWCGANGTNDTGSKPQHLTTYGSITTTADGWDFGTDNGNYFVINGPISNGTSYTVALWSCPDKTAMDSNDTGGWMLADRSISKPDFQLLYYKPDQRVYFSWYNRDAAVSQTFFPNALVQTNWVHLAVVVDTVNSNMYFYRNGASVTQAVINVANPPVNRHDANATIATASWDLGQNTQKYHGKLDKIRFYSLAKPASFIQSIYDAEKGSKGL